MKTEKKVYKNVSGKLIVLSRVNISIKKNSSLKWSLPQKNSEIQFNRLNGSSDFLLISIRMLIKKI